MNGAAMLVRRCPEGSISPPARIKELRDYLLPAQ